MGDKSFDICQEVVKATPKFNEISKQVAEVVKSVENFNWAWQFRTSDSNEWQQFDCTDCLQLEFNFQANKLSETSNFSKVQIVGGVVDLNFNDLYDNFENFKGKV